MVNPSVAEGQMVACLLSTSRCVSETAYRQGRLSEIDGGIDMAYYIAEGAVVKGQVTMADGCLLYTSRCV